MNTFIAALSDLCHTHLLEEKRLIAPSLRVGHQWLESVARSGQPVVNVHIKTLRGLAMDMAGPELLASGRTPLSRLAAVFLMERVWAQCKPGLESYLASVQPSTRFYEKLHQTLLQIRLAGGSGAKLKPKDFEVESKGREIVQLLKAYEEELRNTQKVDYASCLRIALERLHQDASTREALGIVIYPEDQVWRGLEKDLIEALPVEQRKVLPVDSPGKIPSLSFYRAVGEVTEVREVLRRCLEKRLPLDQVEIIVTDPGAYIPLFYELFERLKPDPYEAEDEAKPPVPKLTFAEGIPARYSRPARALSAWLEWIHQDQFLQPVLTAMIRDGLLDTQAQEVSFARLADTLQSLPIGHGQDRYLKAIEWKLQSLQAPRSSLLTQTEEGEPLPGRTEWTSQSKETLSVLKEIVARLIDTCPRPGASPLEVIQSAKSFLGNCARSAGELDAYALKEFREEIDQVLELLTSVNGETVFDPWEWLGSLKDSAHLLGSSPQPGHAHVSSLTNGGHSGRPYTFILGMEDGRFPGGGSQDPLLLDGERHKISQDLATSAGRLQERMEGFQRLLARQRGSVTLSYPCRDLIQDRELFAAPALLVLIEKQHEGKTTAEIETISFAPTSETRCLNETEWWLYHLASRPENTTALDVATARFPHLHRGLVALTSRNGDVFTSYDGYLGIQDELDPCRPEGPVLSAHGLQMIGKCPLSYFFHYVLHIELPKETALDPDVWLDPLATGSLLHEVFREFMAGFISIGKKPSLTNDWETLLEILNKHLTHAEKIIPPLNESAYAKQKREFEIVARVFLTEEEKYADTGTPVYLEASLGQHAQDNPTELDTTEPIRITLPGGSSFRARGRIDRIDQTREGKIQIWDYKTGGDSYYEKDMPYKQGRLIQHALYVELVQSVMKNETVEDFGFFFPGKRARGNRITWKAKDLKEGMEIIQQLCGIVSGGAFLATNAEDDCRYCDYRPICSPIEDVLSQSRVKLENPENQELAHMRELRGISND